MEDARIGRILSEMGNLDGQDIEEILQEQRRVGGRFGQIALAFGLCRVEDVWEAWRRQLEQGHVPWVDLREVGIDARAAARLSREQALKYNVMPVRFTESLVLAADARTVNRARRELPRQCEDSLTFVLAERQAIQEAINRYYATAG